MLKRTTNVVTRIALGGLLLLALVATGPSAASDPASDDPLICPYCGGTFSFESLGVEVSRELGVRAMIRLSVW